MKDSKAENKVSLGHLKANVVRFVSRQNFQGEKIIRTPNALLASCWKATKPEQQFITDIISAATQMEKINLTQGWVILPSEYLIQSTLEGAIVDPVWEPLISQVQAMGEKDHSVGSEAGRIGEQFQRKMQQDKNTTLSSAFQGGASLQTETLRAWEMQTALQQQQCSKVKRSDICAVLHSSMPAAISGVLKIALCNGRYAGRPITCQASENKRLLP